MAENLLQVVKGNALPLLFLVIGLVLLTDPVFGFSDIFPDGVFTLIAGILLLASGVFQYWSESRE